MKRKYPIGLQSFREIREGGYIYIDKTELIHRLVDTGKYYFLSRPRRFGKSLLVDTIEELFNGSKTLFEGLWIHDKWNWEKPHPVIHFDFSDIGVRTLGLEEAIYRGLDANAKRLGLSLDKTSYDQQFKDLIEKASVNGKVVILIDEYDKPIIDFMQEPVLTETNRAVMKNFYSILKGSDKLIRLLLITGVSQFSHVSIFSDLNNLDNITLTTHYGDLLGVTQKELEENFSTEITTLKKENPDILTQLKRWYNGYTWNMKTWVYNPFSLLKFMSDPVFRNYWFATGTPTFLIRQLKSRRIYDVEGIRMGGLALSTFDENNPNPGSLLFQTGYLTIKNISPDGQIYELGYPNREVKASLLDGLLSAYREKPSDDSVALVADIQMALNEGNITGLIRQLNALIATIPYDHWNAGTESIFTVVTFLTFKLAGVDVYSEVHSEKGSCDVLVKTAAYIYVMELKLDGTAQEALQQVMDRRYMQPYMADTRKKIAVGICFSSKQRAVSEYETNEL